MPQQTVDKVDMSLDEIIKSNRSAFKTGRGGGGARGGPRRGRGGPRANGGNPGGRNVGGARKTFGATGAGRKFAPRGPPVKKNNAASGDRWLHDKFRGQNGAAAVGGPAGSSKLTISNLHYGVSDEDVRELFNEFGALKKAAVHYDRSGRSLGTADVIFERRTDALRAMKQYNDVPLDGRPMKIELAGDKPALGGGATGGRVLAGRIGKKPAGRSPQKPQRNSGPRGGNRGAAAAGKGARGGPRRTPKKTPTREQLDAELDAYVSKMEIV